jgi:hypothetical protein
LTIDDLRIDGLIVGLEIVGLAPIGHPIGHQQSAISDRPSAIGHQQSAISNQTINS